MKAPSLLRYKNRPLAAGIALSSLLLLGLLLHYAWSKWAIYELPSEKLNFSALKPVAATEIVDHFGHPLHYIYNEDLMFYRPLNQISPQLKEFVVLLEDAKFFSHGGFDVEEIKNSIEKNLEKGKVKRGASTITQQLAKNLFLGKERTWTRKLFEVPWTLKLEDDLSKAQILELYLNVIEWGPGIRGAEAASRHFFDRAAADLETGQAMYLALIIPNPVRFDALAHPHVLDFLKKKKSWLINRLVDEKKIPHLEKDFYDGLDFGLAAPDSHTRFPLSHEGNYSGNRATLESQDVRRLLEKHLGEFALKTSRRVETTLDAELLKILSEHPLTSSSSGRGRYFVISEEGHVRAFQWVDKGKDYPAEAITDNCAAPYVCAYADSLDWKNLAP